MPNFTEKQRKFIQAVADGLKPVEAGRLVGYSEGGLQATVSRMMQRADVKAAVKRAKGDPNASAADEDGSEQRESFLKPTYKSSLDLLQHLYNNPKAPAGLRVEAAKLALPYEHGKVGDQGKKEAAQERAKSAATKKFAPRRAPGRPHLRAVN